MYSYLQNWRKNGTTLNSNILGYIPPLEIGKAYLNQSESK